MGPDRASLLPIQDTTTEIFLLTSSFCLASQPVSLHWLLLSHNIKLWSSLSKPCHSGLLWLWPFPTTTNSWWQPPCPTSSYLLPHLFGRVPQKHPQINPMIVPLVEKYLCSQYNAQVATQHTDKHHFPSLCSPVCLSPPIFLCLNLGIENIKVCCVARLSPAAAPCPMATETRNNNSKVVTH